VDERAREIWARLLRDRIVFIGTPIDDYVANLVTRQMRLLGDESRSRAISLYINSPGGYLTSSCAILEAMDASTCDVESFVVGSAAGTALQIAAHARGGRRFALSNAHFTLCPLQGPPDQQVASHQAKLETMLAADSKKRVADIRRDMASNLTLSAEQAKKYGLIDEILVEFPRPSARPPRKPARRRGPGAAPLNP